jgi:hypothetical protein
MSLSICLAASFLIDLALARRDPIGRYAGAEKLVCDMGA